MRNDSESTTSSSSLESKGEEWKKCLQICKICKITIRIILVLVVLVYCLDYHEGLTSMDQYSGKIKMSLTEHRCEFKR